uniref:Peptidase S1 domain-containing protein n=1 Tax=Trichuris muris TaxID=70415 RepID=A0A5S6R3W5_TRIMR
MLIYLWIASLVVSAIADYECGVPYFSIQKYDQPYERPNPTETSTGPTTSAPTLDPTLPIGTVHYPSRPIWNFDLSSYPLWFSFGRRIVGGWEARPHSIPWQVRLMVQITSYQYSVCGGSLIQPFEPRNGTQFVLTAAHCVYTEYGYAATSRLKVIVGAHDLNSNSEASQQRIGVKNYVHHSYSDTTKENDISVMQLQRYVAYTSYTRPVCLPKANEELPTNAYCFVSGWGKTSENGKGSSLLRMVDAGILSDDQCYVHNRLQNLVFCGGTLEGGKDSCQGDSGGPLVCEVNGRYYQYGVVSFGAGCARVGHPGVYTRVPTYITWMTSQSRSMESSSPTTWETSDNRDMEETEQSSKEKEYFDNFFIEPEHLSNIFTKVPDFQRPINSHFGFENMQSVFRRPGYTSWLFKDNVDHSLLANHFPSVNAFTRTDEVSEGNKSPRDNMQ